MRRFESVKIVSLVLVALIVTPGYVAAATDLTAEVNAKFYAAGSNDEVQNNLDDSEETNADTWNPVTKGVYFGPWSKESTLRLSDVPVTDFEIALAQVVYVPARVIMSGASYFTVRLPMRNYNTQWNRSVLNVYEIGQSTNWTFEENVTYVDVGHTIAHHMNDFRINFTAGPHQLVYFSHFFEPDDESPSDGDDHYSRDNRTYALVNFPLSPGVFYLFVTYAWYDADSYVDVFFTPEPLAMGLWNRSTVAVYNELAPDDHHVEVTDLNVSLGYSFDFVNGFGESSCGLNNFFYNGDQLFFWSYIDPDRSDTSEYLTVMIPFKAEIQNVSIEVRVWATDVGADDYALLIDDTSEWNDFVLVSDTTDLATGIAGLNNWTGWFRIALDIGNDTRIRFSLWDLPYLNNTGYNETWFYDTGVGWPFNDARWIHDTDWRWNPLEYIEYNAVGGEDRIYHWELFHSLQLNDYYWTQTSGSTPGRTHDVNTRNMTYLQSYFYLQGWLYIQIGKVLSGINAPAGAVLRAYGLGLEILATSDFFPDFAGYVRDALLQAWNALKGLGAWLWRVGQKLVGALHWLVDLGEVILAMIIMIIAFALFAIPTYFTIKAGQAIRKTALGRFDEAVAEVTGAVQTVQKFTGRGG